MAKSSKKPTASPTPASLRAPVVVVMGHVDHGKTTLLDFIRHTNVAARESAGITQHIGAYQVLVPHEGKPTPITFIDTPGHAAFSAMRARGGSVADIAVLVVAADDGVMPQTIEAISHIKAAGIPMIAAINKMDVPGANVDRVKKGLSEHGVLVQGYGGDVEAYPISAKTGDGVPELLELILITAELAELKTDPTLPPTGIVIESKLDKFRGPLATLIIKNGTLKIGQDLVVGGVKGRVKQMIDGFGAQVKEAGPSTPVEILGLEAVPDVGSEIGGAGAEAPASTFTQAGTLEELMSQEKKPDEISLIVKADVQGSLEAITGSLAGLPQETTKLKVIHAGTGEISDSDVNLARATGSLILGFRVKTNPSVVKLAETQDVKVMNYDVIYQLLDDLKAALEGISLEENPVPIGTGEILATFPHGTGLIMGTRVTDGAIARDQPIKIVRGELEIAAGRVKSIRHLKDEVPKAEAGKEYGIFLDLSRGEFTDINVGDKLLSFPKS